MSLNTLKNSSQFDVNYLEISLSLRSALSLIDNLIL